MYFIVSILNDMSISTAFLIWFIYLLPEDNLKNTHKPMYFLNRVFIVFTFHK